MNAADARTATARAVWVVVADHAHARFFFVDGPEVLTEMEDLVNPDARLHEGELVSDRPGRLNSRRRGGNSARGAESHRQFRADAFARQVGARIDALRRGGELTHLHLVAEPDFLGMLRKHLGTDTTRCVLSETARSVARQRPKQLRALLPAHL